MLDTFSIHCRSMDESQSDVLISPSGYPSDPFIVPEGQVVFQYPRTLGRGVDNFDEHGMPQTPVMYHVDPPLLSLENSGSQEEAFVPWSLEGGELVDNSSGSNHHNSNHPSSIAGSVRMSSAGKSHTSFALASTTTRSSPLVLVRGGASFCGAHITLRLLVAGYNVRLLAQDCCTSTAQLKALVKQRLNPQAANRLFIFRGTELMEALDGCDFVVCNSEPAEIGQLTTQEDIQKCYLEDMQDLFLSIHNVCKLQPYNGAVSSPQDSSASFAKGRRPPPKIVWLTTAATVFPVITTSRQRSQYIISAKALALKEAERIAKKAGIPLVVLLHSIVVGGALTDAKDEAHFMLAHLAKGHRWFRFVPHLYWNFVDVQDVAEGVYQALVNEAAVDQRFLLSDSELSLKSIGCLLEQRFPTLHPPTTELPNVLTLLLLTLFGHLGEKVSYQYLKANLGRRFPLQNRKARRHLHIKFHSAIDAIVTMVEEVLGIEAVNTPPINPSILGGAQPNSSLSTSSSQSNLDNMGSLTSDSMSQTPLLASGAIYANHPIYLTKHHHGGSKRKRTFPILPVLTSVAALSLGTGMMYGLLTKQR